MDRLRIPDWKWILKWKVVYLLRHGRRFGSDYEESVRRVIMALSGQTFWDVGANTGYYTLKLARRFNRVIAFEPNPSAVGILKQRIAKAHVTNVTIIPQALSDQEGRSKLILLTKVRANTVGSSNTIMPQHPNQKQGTPTGQGVSSSSVEVETTTVDKALGEGTIDLMKIDVEGAEFIVLNGARKSLDSGRIHRLVIELHDNGRRGELETLLKKYDYRTEWLDHNLPADTSHVLATRDSRSPS